MKKNHYVGENNSTLNSDQPWSFVVAIATRIYGASHWLLPNFLFDKLTFRQIDGVAYRFLHEKGSQMIMISASNITSTFTAGSTEKVSLG